MRRAKRLLPAATLMLLTAPGAFLLLTAIPVRVRRRPRERGGMRCQLAFCCPGRGLSCRGCRAFTGFAFLVRCKGRRAVLLLVARFSSAGLGGCAALLLAAMLWTFCVSDFPGGAAVAGMVRLQLHRARPGYGVLRDPDSPQGSWASELSWRSVRGIAGDAPIEAIGQGAYFSA